MEDPTETPTPSTESPSTSPTDGASPDSSNSLEAEPTPTVTETVTLPAEPVMTCTSADPCVVAPSEPVAVPLWTALGLVLLLLAAILAAQLRRP